MLRKSLVGLIVVASFFVLTGTAMALQDPSGGKGNIVPNQHTKVTGTLNLSGNGNYKEYVQGIDVTTPYTDSFNISSHVQGTWNSPYTAGIDGYNYNDPQDYVAAGDQNPANAYRFQSGPHGGYLTSTHRCRECHAVHRAAGKFKLLRSDTRFEACDWCHGTGAGSGFNIQMDNNDDYTTEYNVGHTMGFGIDTGKWKAPDDTYPAFTPNYWQGGFSCFDCHSPHANPARMLGYNDAGQVQGLAWADTEYYGGQTRYYSIVNPGHGASTDAPGDSIACVDCHKRTVDEDGNFLAGYPTAVPLYQAGSWLLLKNADREIAVTSETIDYFRVGDVEGQAGTIETMDIAVGQEISDLVFAYSELVGGEASVTAGQLHQFDTDTAYPVNKIPIDWNTPMGIAKSSEGSAAMTVRTYLATEPAHTGVWNVNEFCTDCHDGNSGLHTVAAPLFSEDRALRNQGNNNDGAPIDNFRGNYDIAYGHDQNSRHCGRQMQFNPEDVTTFGPHCRNCHKGSSGCGRCHSQSSGILNISRAIYTSNLSYASDNSRDRAPYEEFPGAQGQSTLHVNKTSTGAQNMVFDSNFTTYHANAASNATLSFMYKKSRTVDWYDNWRTATGYVQMGKMMANGNESGVGVACSDDGFSWPHRTLGWKMLKDDLFGLNFNGTPVAVGGTRNYGGTNYTVHDLDSVCLDCHNPTVWRATSAGDYEDTSTTSNDNHDDELLTRGLP
ncbi:MAG: hypothetical protein Q8J63_00155 [Candidatus Aquicultor sp.]|nr:hypothetical protein [Candidatus Aquicultor sp.]